MNVSINDYDGGFLPLYNRVMMGVKTLVYNIMSLIGDDTPSR